MNMKAEKFCFVHDAPEVSSDSPVATFITLGPRGLQEGSERREKQASKQASRDHNAREEEENLRTRLQTRPAGRHFLATPETSRIQHLGRDVR